MADSDRGPWSLPIVGFEVTDVWFSGQLYVIAYGDPIPGDRQEQRAKIAFGGAFVFRRPDGQERALDALKPWATATVLLGLRAARITEAIVDREGNLAVSFNGDLRLRAAPDERYENWEVTGPGFNVVAPPGGGDPRITWNL